MIGLVRKSCANTVLEDVAEWAVMLVVSLATLVSTLRLLGILS